MRKPKELFIGNVTDLKQRIYRAFQDLPCPLPNQLIVPTNELNQKAAQRTRDLFAGQDWRELSWDFLKEKWANFCYFTAQAFQ